MKENEAIVRATQVAHQAALDEHVRVKNDLAKLGVCADDFDVMSRYAIAEFDVAIKRDHEV